MGGKAHSRLQDRHGAQHSPKLSPAHSAGANPSLGILTAAGIPNSGNGTRARIQKDKGRESEGCICKESLWILLQQ